MTCAIITLMTEVTSQTFDDALSEIGDWIASSSYAQAIERCNALAKSYPDAVRLIRLRAITYELQGQATQAIDDYRHLLDIIPADAPAMAGLARSLANAGQHAESAVFALQALAILPEDPDALSIVGRLEDGPVGRGQMAEVRWMFRGGLTNRAFSLIHKLTLAAPDRTDIQIMLAEMLWRSGYKVSTVELCQNILDAQPDCLNAHVILAAVWAQIGNMDIADVHHLAVEHYDPDYRATSEWLGDASPFFVRDAPASPASTPQDEVSPPAAADIDSELDRSAWVDELIAAAGPVAPDAQSSPPSTLSLSKEQDATSSARQLPGEEADIDYDGKVDDTIDTTPLEWIPVHIEDQIDDIPAWLSALSAEKAPATMADRDPNQPADDSAHTPRTGTVTKWSPEPPPTVTFQLATKPTLQEATAVTATNDAQSTLAQEPAATDESTSAPNSALVTAPSVSELGDADSALPARKKERKTKSTTTRPKLAIEEVLGLAHKALEAGDYESAADHYAALIKAGRKLDTVLADLETVTQAHPRVRRFQTMMGDIYTRKGDVNSALIAYHRALETTENRENGD